MAVAPWNMYPGIAFTLNIAPSRRNTPAIMATIQANEINHTTTAATHQNIVYLLCVFCF
jgi:hypothetical protein